MAVHWFAWLFFGLAIASLLLGLLNNASDARFAGFMAALVLAFIGVCSAGHASNQNEGLASRNINYFKAQGFRVLSAYGHKVCIAAGPHKLCLQERKDATGKKQLVAPLASGKWFVVHGPDGGFMDALSHAPPD
jgi:hypothetical protein